MLIIQDNMQQIQPNLSNITIIMGSSPSSSQSSRKEKPPQHPPQNKNKQKKKNTMDDGIEQVKLSTHEVGKPTQQANPLPKETKETNELPPISNRQRYGGNAVPDLIIETHREQKQEEQGRQVQRMTQKQSLHSLPNSQRTQPEESHSPESFFQSIKHTDRKQRTQRNNNISIEEINSDFDDQPEEKVTKRREKKYRVHRM